MLTEAPTDRVDNVALTASVWSHQRRDALREFEPGRAGEALKAGNLECFQEQGKLRGDVRFIIVKGKLSERPRLICERICLTCMATSSSAIC